MRFNGKASLKFWKLGLMLMALLALPAAGAEGVAPSNLVQSHAWIYPSDNEANPLLIYAVVQQPGTLDFLVCRNNTGIPASAPALAALLGSSNCAEDDGQIPGDLQSVALHKVFHQSGSDRYVNLKTSILWDDGQAVGKADDMIGTTSVTFNSKAPDSLVFVYTFVDNVDGQNTGLSTVRATHLKAFDASVPLPQITQKPIEQ